jgi:two-component system, OmpR family, phosphate regulon sensor histidine kinase PhoR
VPQPGSRPALLAVRAAEVLRPVEERRGLRFVPVHEPRGEALGEALPGLKAVIEPLPGGGRKEGDRQRTLFYASLGLLAAAMVYAAWLLWRDLQREVRVSEMRSQFVSSVSHELKTPLTAIRMLAETLQMGRGRDSEKQDEYLETIVHECERLGRLVDGVLLFSRIEQQRKVFRFRALDVGESVRAALRTMEHPLSQRGFRLALAVEPDLPPVEADDDSLQQSVLNLLGNAMKYSGESRDIEVSVARAGASVAIRVADHGIGIPAGEQGRIWEKFYRAETPENRHIPGAGLGLALVAQIAKAHGGTVEVLSELGKSSAFTVLLPVKRSV